MSKRWFISGVAVVTVVAFCTICSWCLWFDKPSPRFSQTFDLGEGRTLQVWSIRDYRDWSDPCPLMVYYRVDCGQTELVHTTFLDHDDLGEYRFKVVFADNRRLACVYQVTHAKEHSGLFLMFDDASGESWPRLRDDETPDDPEVIEKWSARFRQLKNENPEIPDVEGFSGRVQPR